MMMDNALMMVIMFNEPFMMFRFLMTMFLYFRFIRVVEEERFLGNPGEFFAGRTGGAGSAAEVFEDGAESFGCINRFFAFGMFGANPCHLDEGMRTSKMGLALRYRR